MLFVVCHITISAQPKSSFEIKTGSVSGRVMDAKLKQPLPYVNVVIKSKTNEILTGGIKIFYFELLIHAQFKAF